MAGVMALSGIRPRSPGMELKRLHSSAITAPQRMVIGIRLRWLLDCSSIRAICGTARPMNDTGPQNAVIMATSKLVESSSQLRVRIMFIPRFSAYISPSSSALSGLISDTAMASPTATTGQNTLLVHNIHVIIKTSSTSTC